MSNSVSDFMKKGGVKAFKNGLNAFKKLSTPKKLMACGVLAAAFTVATNTKNYNSVENRSKAQTAYAIMENGDTLCSYRAIPTTVADFARLQKLVNNATKTETGREIIKGLSKTGTSGTSMRRCRSAIRFDTRRRTRFAKHARSPTFRPLHL